MLLRAFLIITGYFSAASSAYADTTMSIQLVQKTSSENMSLILVLAVIVWNGFLNVREKNNQKIMLEAPSEWTVTFYCSTSNPGATGSR